MNMKSILPRMPVFIAFLFASMAAHAYSVEMSEADLQSVVAAGFPMVQQTPLVKIVFSEPKIRIVKDTGRLRLSVAADLSAYDGIHASSKAEIEGEIAYDSMHGQFHLRYPALVGLTFNQLAPAYHKLLSATVGAFIEQQLPIVVLYQLDSKDFRQAIMLQTLKSVKVKDGILIAELGL
jgi:hypothetical protein